MVRQLLRLLLGAIVLAGLLVAAALVLLIVVVLVVVGATAAALLLGMATVSLILVGVSFAPAIAMGVALLSISWSPRLGRWLARTLSEDGERDRKRLAYIFGGVFAVMVPTFFTVFPHWGLHWSVGARVGIVIAWGIAAGTVVMATVRQGGLLEDMSAEEKRRAKTVRRKSASLLMRAYLSPSNTGLSADYAAQIFVPDRDQERLLPRWDPGRWGPKEGWRIGGPPYPVTVEAWMTNSYAHVQGAAVTDARYGLTPEQQFYYGNIAGVSAQPIPDARGKLVGVLVFLTSLPPEESRIGEDDFIDLNRGWAEVLGQVLVHLGDTMDDD